MNVIAVLFVAGKIQRKLALTICAVDCVELFGIEYTVDLTGENTFINR